MVGEFDVWGKRVTVAGAARSGIAASELLVRRGALVTLSDIRTQVPEVEPLRQLDIELELGGHRTETFANADLVVTSPGVSVTSYSMGIPIDLYTPIFAVSRISGWTAHVLEQYANNRLIRPRAEYTGPPVPQQWVALDAR